MTAIRVQDLFAGQHRLAAPVADAIEAQVRRHAEEQARRVLPGEAALVLQEPHEDLLG
jgi:hypothetical protein